MITVDELYEEATNDDILVVNHKLSCCAAMSVCDGENCIVVVDEKQTANTADCKVKTAHEIGHCKTMSFYTQYTPFAERGQFERRADKWAVQRLMPSDEFLSAIRSGCVEIWELAEYFDVTEDFVCRACEIYRAMGIL